MGRGTVRLFAWLCLFGLGGSLSLSLLRFQRNDRETKAAALDACRTQARAAAQEIQEDLVPMREQVSALSRDLATGALDPRDLRARLRKALAAVPRSATRMGVLLRRPGPAGSLRGPFVERGPGGIRAFEYAAAADDLAWARPGGDSAQPAWGEPRRDPDTGDLWVHCSGPVRLPGVAGAAGIVRLEVSLKEIQKRVASLGPGTKGYGFLLSGKGTYLADPLDARVRNGETLEDVARRMGDAGRLHIAQAAAARRAGFAESVSSVTGQATWIFLEPVPAADWSLGFQILKAELDLSPPGLNRTLVALVSLALGTAATALFLALGLPTREGGRLWVFSAGVAILLASGTGLLWHFTYVDPKGPRTHEVPVMSEASRDDFLKAYARLGTGLREVQAEFVPTGIFIQQLETAGSGRMKVSGQVWQKFPKGASREGRGVTFPEGANCDVGPGIVKDEGDTEVHVYPFRGVFPMELGSIVDYPFDQSSVRLRVWPRLTFSNIVLTPDLEAYTLLIPSTLPGIDRGLGLAGWDLESSHFSFFNQRYNTNFGIQDYNGQQDSPELVYTLTLQRSFTSPFIATFLPILVVAGLLFTLVLTTTRLKERVAATGYNAVNILRSVISLFFPVVVSQINLRNNVLTEGLLLVEYHYFVIYCMILLVAVNSLVVAFGGDTFLLREDNRIVKLAFWPALAGAFYGISILYIQ